jgi:hypothetical protein
VSLRQVTALETISERSGGIFGDHFIPHCQNKAIDRYPENQLLNLLPKD